MEGVYILLLGGALVTAIGMALSARVVHPDEEMVVFRLGRTRPELVYKPGLVFVLPVMDVGVRVDMGDRYHEVRGTRVVTSDGVPVELDFVIRWRIDDALNSLVGEAKADDAEHVFAETAAGVIARTSLGDTRRMRDVAAQLRLELDNQARRWGATVSEVDIHGMKQVLVRRAD